MDFWSKLWKQSEEFGFLRECPAHILQQKLRDLDRAFRDAFDRTQPNKRIPKFKKRMQGDSFRYPAPKQVKLEYQHITFPKLGRVRFYRSRAIEGEIKNYTLSRRGKHWYVSIQVELEIQHPIKMTNVKPIGIDMGIKYFVTTSEGEHVLPKNSFRNLEKKLAIKQRRLSRKKRFSENWKKAKQQIDVSPRYTSQRCSCCQHIARENRQSQEKFACIRCHKKMNADVNAAKNILAAGHAVLACGASALARR